jgi:hypothetical protein
MGKKKSGKRKRPQDEDIQLDNVDDYSVKLKTAKNPTHLPLTDQCHHYDRLVDVPFDIQK